MRGLSEVASARTVAIPAALAAGLRDSAVAVVLAVPAVAALVAASGPPVAAAGLPVAAAGLPVAAAGPLAVVGELLAAARV